MNFNEYKVNCTEIYDLVKNKRGNLPPTEKQTADYNALLDKKLSELNKTQLKVVAKYINSLESYDPTVLSNDVSSSAREILIREKYGYNPVYFYENEVNIRFRNAILQEPESIRILSKNDRKTYVKNEKMYENQYFKGIPDIITKRGRKIVKVQDIKVCTGINSFEEKKNREIDDAIYWQMQGYMDILKLDEASVVFVLPNLADLIISQIKENAFEKWFYEGVPQMVIQKRLKQLEENCKFDKMPINYRVHKVVLKRNDYDIKMAQERVYYIRKYFQDFNSTLPEIDSNEEENSIEYNARNSRKSHKK